MSMITYNHALVVVFDVIVLIGVLLVSFTLITAICSKAVKRSITWYSLITAWLVYSLSYGLLVGRQEGPPPPIELCLMQATLIYAVPALVASGMVCYYIEFYLVISSLKSGNPRPASYLRTLSLATIPWLTFLVIITEDLLLIYPGGRFKLVQRADNNFYCNIRDNIPNQVTASVVLFCMIILIPLEVWTGVLMYRNWDVFRRLSQKDRQVFVTIYLRLILCTVAAIIAFAFSALAFALPTPDATSLVYPTLPIFIMAAFGTQKDLLRAWLFWRPPKPYGSLVFNQGTQSAITTNIVTSCEPASNTNTFIQQQQAKQGIVLGADHAKQDFSSSKNGGITLC